MEILERAASLLAETERSLHDLIQEGLRRQSYGEVAQLVRMAERLAALRAAHPVVGPLAQETNEPGTSESQPAPDREGVKSHGELSGRRTSPTQNGSRASYPRFERDGDKLVKVGWSDRDRRIYEHRAPKAAVFHVCEAISSHSPKGRRFKMEEILPDLAAGEDPIPSYQAYLTLAWLRGEGIVDRDGKDGYRIKSGQLSADQMRKLWESLSERP